MHKFILFIETSASAVLRYGIGAVILWFSIQQFIHNSAYVGFIPDSIVSLTHISANILVFFNAMFELVFGLLLVFGWQTRIVATLLALHMFDIMWVVGYGDIGVRDFGIAVGILVVAMNGSDLFCITQKRKGEEFIQGAPEITSMNPLA